MAASEGGSGTVVQCSQQNEQNRTMTTLYDILGLGRRANAMQIEAAYALQLKTLETDESRENGDGVLRLRAIKDAYLVLSTPAKRQLYDQKLRAKEAPPRELQVVAGPPWGWILLAVAVLGGGGAYLLISHQHQLRLANIQLQAEQAAAQAKLAAELAAQQADDERVRRLNDARDEQRRSLEADRRLSAEGRAVGARVDYDLARADAQAQREQRAHDQQLANDARRAQMEAEYRARNENLRMERALQIPILRH